MFPSSKQQKLSLQLRQKCLANLCNSRRLIFLQINKWKVTIHLPHWFITNILLKIILLKCDSKKFSNSIKRSNVSKNNKRNSDFNSYFNCSFYFSYLVIIYCLSKEWFHVSMIYHLVYQSTVWCFLYTN